MTMSGKNIKEAIENGELEINPFEEEHLQPASYDFRIGKEGITYKSRKLTDIERNHFMIVDLGEFGVIISLEKFNLSVQIVGLIGMQTKPAKQGLFDLLDGLLIRDLREF